MRIVSLLLITAITLSACARSDGRSNLNPFNWFRKAEVTEVVYTEAIDPRSLVTQIISLTVDRVPGGAIINAVGLPDTQGYHTANLVPLNSELPDKATLRYEFRLLAPQPGAVSGSQRSREVLVAHFVSDQTLAGVRRIEVIALNNRRTARR